MYVYAEPVEYSAEKKSAKYISLFMGKSWCVSYCDSFLRLAVGNSFCAEEKVISEQFFTSGFFESELVCALPEEYILDKMILE